MEPRIHNYCKIVAMFAAEVDVARTVQADPVHIQVAVSPAASKVIVDNEPRVVVKVITDELEPLILTNTLICPVDPLPNVPVMFPDEESSVVIALVTSTV